MTDQKITPEILAGIPDDHRRTIARWLLERAGSYQPSIFINAHTAEHLHRALLGAAVDLAEPLADDTTIGFAAGVVTDLLSDPEPTFFERVADVRAAVDEANAPRYACAECSFATTMESRAEGHRDATGHPLRLPAFEPAARQGDACSDMGSGPAHPTV